MNYIRYVLNSKNYVQLEIYNPLMPRSYSFMSFPSCNDIDFHLKIFVFVRTLMNNPRVSTSPRYSSYQNDKSVSKCIFMMHGPITVPFGAV